MVLPEEYGGRGEKLTTHLHPVPRLRMNGDIYISTPPIRPQGAERDSFTFVL